MKKMKQALQVFAVLIFIGGMDLLVFGCSTVGNGKVDLPVEVSIEWHDNFGNGFVFVGGELTEATYQSTQTGILYKYTDEAAGSFMVAAPDGKTKIRLRKKTAAECWTL